MQPSLRFALLTKIWIYKLEYCRGPIVPADVTTAPRRDQRRHHLHMTEREDSPTSVLPRRSFPGFLRERFKRERSLNHSLSLNSTPSMSPNLPKFYKAAQSQKKGEAMKVIDVELKQPERVRSLVTGTPSSSILTFLLLRARSSSRSSPVESATPTLLLTKRSSPSFQGCQDMRYVHAVYRAISRYELCGRTARAPPRAV